MLQLSNVFINRNVLSLRTGGQIGSVTDPIINPNNLKIEGWKAEIVREKGEYVVPSGEVRDFIAKGIVVNDHDAITHPDDLVRLKPVIAINFSLLGKNVVTESKKKVGKVTDYAVDEGFYIQKLYVSPSIIRGLSASQKIISRDVIVEITDKKIVVSDPSVRSTAGVTAAAEA